MKRKLIKIGDSTLLISVPREWVVANNLGKGDEIEIQADQDKLTLWCDSRVKKERLVIDVTEFGNMLSRLIYSVYRIGIDEVEFRTSNSESIDSIKSTIWKEAVGYEIIDQGQNFCKIVNVSGKIDDFQNILRRLFLVTLTMSGEAADSLRKGRGFEKIIYMEQENNRLATMLIRAINKYGSHGFKKAGPLYYIIQELERIGDQYKYLAQLMMKKNGKAPLSRQALRIFEDSSGLLRDVYDFFYSFQPAKSNEIKISRSSIIGRIYKEYSQKLSGEDIALLSHSLNIATRAFDMVDSMIILRL